MVYKYETKQIGNAKEGFEKLEIQVGQGQMRVWESDLVHVRETKSLKKVVENRACECHLHHIPDT